MHAHQHQQCGLTSACVTVPAAIWKMLGNMNGQQKGIVEERFKTVDRDLAKKGKVAGYKRAAFETSTAAANNATHSLRSSHDGPVLGAQHAAGYAGSHPAAAPPAAGGYYAAPGQLSSSAGLISLSAVPEAGGPKRPADAATFTLQPGECGPGSQHPSMLLTGPPGRGLAAGAPGSSAAPTGQGMSVQIPEGAVGVQSAPTSATAGPPKYQPLQSLSSPTEIYEEWDRCLSVLQHGEDWG